MCVHGCMYVYIYNVYIGMFMYVRICMYIHVHLMKNEQLNSSTDPRHPHLFVVF